MSFYIRQFLPYLAVSAVVYLPFRLRKKRSSLIPDLIFFVYIVALLMLTVLPMVFVAQHGLLVRLPCADVLLGLGKIETIPQPSERSLQLQPFATVTGLLTDDALPQRVRLYRAAANILGNLALLMPFGFLFPLKSGAGLGKTCAVGLTAVLGIEIIQYFEGRVADIDDVILNFVGILLGFAAYCIFTKIKALVRSRKELRKA